MISVIIKIANKSMITSFNLYDACVTYMGNK